MLGADGWDRLDLSSYCPSSTTTRPLRGCPPLGKAQGIINDLIFVIKPREDCQLKEARGGRGVDFLIQKSIDKRTYTALLLRQQYIFNVTFESNKRESGPKPGRPSPFLAGNYEY